MARSRLTNWGNLTFAFLATVMMTGRFLPLEAWAGAKQDSTSTMQPGPAPAMATAVQLEELVSPVALYPDVLVAQILAASTYPDQVVEAYWWLKENSKLSRDQLSAGVKSQPWDPSIKSLCQFPTVLQTMNDSLAWTSALGQAYYNQPTEVMSAIQRLRNRAVDAGSLKSTPQQKVEIQPATSVVVKGSEQPATTQQTVIIQPTQPNTVYAPQYDPTSVYGAPVQAAPGYTGTEVGRSVCFHSVSEWPWDP